eukprot:TRINITY_DN1042_c0_g1_i1.p1 TRINITY_DN1042_c0_g1~~TRINITY_DN1042_c0_g1_i1.p1  ORF type:complete len:1087 (+),score=458.45 TRINITY_DN1042_c0_g1_i1:101-3361(+)
MGKKKPAAKMSAEEYFASLDDSEPSEPTPSSEKPAKKPSKPSKSETKEAVEEKEEKKPVTEEVVESVEKKEEGAGGDDGKKKKKKKKASGKDEAEEGSSKKAKKKKTGGKEKEKEKEKDKKGAKGGSISKLVEKKKELLRKKKEEEERLRREEEEEKRRIEEEERLEEERKKKAEEDRKKKLEERKLRKEAMKKEREAQKKEEDRRAALARLQTTGIVIQGMEDMSMDDVAKGKASKRFRGSKRRGKKQQHQEEGGGEGEGEWEEEFHSAQPREDKKATESKIQEKEEEKEKEDETVQEEDQDPNAWMELLDEEESVEKEEVSGDPDHDAWMDLVDEEEDVEKETKPTTNEEEKEKGKEKEESVNHDAWMDDDDDDNDDNDEEGDKEEENDSDHIVDVIDRFVKDEKVQVKEKEGKKTSAKSDAVKGTAGEGIAEPLPLLAELEKKEGKEKKGKKANKKVKKSKKEAGDDIEDRVAVTTPDGIRIAEASETEKNTLRSPICAILGHVDTGKTKILDRIRKSKVQEGEAGGITQQIGASFFPVEELRRKTKSIPAAQRLQLSVPGLLVIDTPGHESFANLRSRGSSLCDIAILVVDIMHGLQQQTLESLHLLRVRNSPFIVALNKIDRMYGWEPHQDAPLRDTMKKQEKHVRDEYDARVQKTITEFAEQGINAIEYHKNKDFRKYVSLVGTSAVTGEGIPDLLMLLVQLAQRFMTERLTTRDRLECSVLEVKMIEGLGTTIDVILVNGVLHEGDEIVVCGLNGPIVTNIRALLTPKPMHEIRVKTDYIHHKVIYASQGVKIAAPDLVDAIAGSSLYVVGDEIDREAAIDLAKKEVSDLNRYIDKSGYGVFVQASTLGSLEALLSYLEQVEIPVSGIGVGPVHRKNVMAASTMLEHKKEYAVILAFDVRVGQDAARFAEECGVRIFTADIIYHLFDMFKKYVEDIEAEKKKEAMQSMVHPCKIKVIPEYIFNRCDPIIVGVEVLDGVLHVGTPLVIPTRKNLDVGRIQSIELNRKTVPTAKKGDQVSVKIVNRGSGTTSEIGKDFTAEDVIYSHLTKKSLEVMRTYLSDEMSEDEIRFVVEVRKAIGL